MITWDFDVMKGDVQFTVFRHKRPREAISSNSLSSFGSDASINQSGVIAGVDAMVVEKPRHCVDGESIQVCFYKGLPRGIYYHFVIHFRNCKLPGRAGKMLLLYFSWDENVAVSSA